MRGLVRIPRREVRANSVRLQMLQKRHWKTLIDPGSDISERVRSAS